MADIELYEEDSDDKIESDICGDVGYEDYDSDPADPDAGLTMLQRLEKYCQDANMYTRQMVTRSLLETIRTIDTPEEGEVLVGAICTLADDPESMVRSELMEHIPHVAIFCLENQHIFGNPVASHLLPIVVRNITDTKNQVRKTSQDALLILLEQEMIKREDVETQVCPVILELGHQDSLDDFRTEAAALMSKLAPLVGKEATERLFLQRFSEMCTDALFHVRKVCASNFGEFCQVVGQTNTEEILLNKFYYLCEDGVWGVRKACAECFMQVSCVCSLHCRRSQLAQLFVSLICDQSRWVRMAAFQSLGRFISTFADPRNTGLYYSEEGVLSVGSPEDFITDSPESTLSRLADNHCDNQKLQGESSPHTDIPRETPRTDRSEEESNTDRPEESPMDVEESDQQEEITQTTSAIDELHLDQPSTVDSDGDMSQTSGTNTTTTQSNTTTSGDVSAVSTTATATEGVTTDSASVAAADTLLSSNGANDSSTNSDSRKFNESEETDDVFLENNLNDSSKKVHIHMDNNNTAFNTFQFWRMPLPEIDVDVDIIDGKAANIHIKTKVKDTEAALALVSEFDVKVEDSDSASNSGHRVTSSMTEEMEVEEDDEDDTPTLIHIASVNTVLDEEEEEVANIGSTHIVGHRVNEKALKFKEGHSQDKDAPALSVGGTDDQDSDEQPEFTYGQDVIPQALLEHYLSMIDPTRAQTVDSEIAKHCAYSLPAVAYTLGRKYWPCLKDLYERLASDMQWKVRRTLAFSIHELAVIVGQDITCLDLVPVFNGFMKDLDEVRIGILKHLADFLKLLRPAVRQEYLTKIMDFFNTDNIRNWRFREELALQLRSLIDLYSTEDISEHLVPIAFLLAEDSVADVRDCAFSVLSAMVGRMSQIGDSKLLAALVQDIQERYAQSDRWVCRQMYVHICCKALEESSLPLDQFAKDMFPEMLRLGQDPIPNVRITLSRTIAKYVLHSDYLTSGQNPTHEHMMEVIQGLQKDSDRDVRYYLLEMTSASTDLGSDTIPV